MVEHSEAGVERSSERVGAWNSGAWERVRALDPLDADELLTAVPRMNERREIGALLGALHCILPSPALVSGWSFEAAAAAMRDLGILLGSLKRHDIEPTQALPELEASLLALAAITGLPPRDNVLHYTVWNPRGPTMRCYTRLPEERALVEAVRQCAPLVYPSIDELWLMRALPVDSEHFALLAERCARRMRALVLTMRRAKRTIDPLVFVTELRPYFEAIEVDGQLIKGPGAVEMPLFMIDHLLWSSDTRDPVLTTFKTSYVPDQLPYLRRYYAHASGRRSLIQRVIAALERGAGARVRASGRGLLELLGILMRFRGPHLYLARKAYRSQHSSYEVGSGGYPPTTLEHVLAANRRALRRLADALS